MKLGITLVGTETLPNHIQELAKLLNGGVLPKEVWLVIHEDKFIALFLDEGSAFARLQHVIEGLHLQQLPEVQNVNEIELLLEQQKSRAKKLKI